MVLLLGQNKEIAGLSDDHWRIVIVAALLPVAALFIKLLAYLLVRAFPSLKRFHK